MKMKAKTKTKNKEVIQDAEYSESQEKIDDAMIIFQAVLRDKVGDKYETASINFVEQHSFNSLMVASLLHLLLSSYISLIPDDEKVNFASDCVNGFLDYLRGGGESGESEENVDQTETASSSGEGETLFSSQ
jgi:hypothetical protein